MKIVKQIALDAFAFFALDFLIALFLEPLWRMLPAALILGFVAITTYHILLDALIYKFNAETRTKPMESEARTSPL